MVLCPFVFAFTSDSSSTRLTAGVLDTAEMTYYSQICCLGKAGAVTALVMYDSVSC